MISTTKRLLINEWLSSDDDTLRKLSLDDAIIETVLEFLDNPENDIELMKLITKKLYELYQNDDPHLRLLTICFLPSLIAIYIRVAHNYYNISKTEFHSLAILLLTIYNCEIMVSPSQPPQLHLQTQPSQPRSDGLKTIDVRIINLSKPSIYHEPNNHTILPNVPVPPTQHSLEKMNQNMIENQKISIFGPYEPVEQLLTSNYMAVCAVLLKIYNQNLTDLGTFSHNSLCHYYLRLLKQGTNIDIRQKIKDHLLQDNSNNHFKFSTATSNKYIGHQLILPRNCIPIQLSCTFMVELTRSIYYCIYNELADIAFEILELITRRATMKLYTDVLLMVNAIKNSIAIKYDRDNSIEGTPAANVSRTASKTAASHTTSMNSLNSFTNESRWNQVRKNAITNASFKTRKLPDDIPIITGNPPAANAPTSSALQEIARHQAKQNASNSTNVNLPQSSVPQSPASQTSQSTSSTHHSHNHPLVLQNSKNLDSIDEEGITNGETSGIKKKSGGKMIMKNLFNKPNKPKSVTPNSGKENGKLLNNIANKHSNSHRISRSVERDSDTSTEGRTASDRSGSSSKGLLVSSIRKQLQSSPNSNNLKESKNILSLH
ncbi:hypothetical protein RDWZM_008030 [Blomia tropicalis]|uniref:Hyccin n=1 Tax=Blomia tropicalis TaxID=40697 RepID=A0A9Q0LYK4_BLOTA|nr:hypothetical protein RDWZM_008030 [Blomia tropicalis]